MNAYVPTTCVAGSHICVVAAAAPPLPVVAVVSVVGRSHCVLTWGFTGTGATVTHFLYRVSEGKKTTRSQFSVQGLREIYRNLKQEKKFNSRESFFRKSPFCTFSCINSGFGGPLDKL